MSGVFVDETVKSADVASGVVLAQPVSSTIAIIIAPAMLQTNDLLFIVVPLVYCDRLRRSHLDHPIADELGKGAP
jgi:hypothetical protein